MCCKEFQLPLFYWLWSVSGLDKEYKRALIKSRIDTERLVGSKHLKRFLQHLERKWLVQLSLLQHPKEIKSNGNLSRTKLEVSLAIILRIILADFCKSNHFSWPGWWMIQLTFLCPAFSLVMNLGWAKKWIWDLSRCVLFHTQYPLLFLVLGKCFIFIFLFLSPPSF